MVLILSIASLALAAISAVSGRVVPRKTAPAGWNCSDLEVCRPFRAFICYPELGWQPYNKYHERYLSFDCQDHHGTEYFDQCCHPRLVRKSGSCIIYPLIPRRPTRRVCRFPLSVAVTTMAMMILPRHRTPLKQRPRPRQLM
jgi:hypothetical protein